MYREVFTKLVQDLSRFNSNELIVVTYDKSSHLLVFRQLNQVILAPYLSPFYLPKKGFKVGVLTPGGLNKLLYSLNTLLGSNLIDEGRYIPKLDKLSTKWYRYFGTKTMPVPEVNLELKYVNVTNRLCVWYLCNHFNHNSKIIHKAVINELKLMKKVHTTSESDNNVGS